jgi:hypothetical protein
MIRHAGLVAIRRNGFWAGVLLEGPSGSGKSDLALRMLAAGFRLVADDRVLVWACEGRLFGRAPAALSDLIEIRGLDVVRETALPMAEIRLVARCGATEGERIPALNHAEIAGISVGAIDVLASAASAPAKLSRALQHLG